MLNLILKTLFYRDLNKLKDELEAYQHEDNIWRIDSNISNSAGNLCLHLIGNLNAYIGAELGGTGYKRNRPEEFSKKDIPSAQLINDINQTIAVVEATLSTLTEEQMNAEFPIQVLPEKVSTAFFLVHLATHLSYHLGQINYHRRMLDAETL